ncbi:MAG: hypothetical protein ACYDIC_00275 [Desulfobaccales bacterium]
MPAILGKEDEDGNQPDRNFLFASPGDDGQNPIDKAGALWL